MHFHKKLGFFSQAWQFNFEEIKFDFACTKNFSSKWSCNKFEILKAWPCYDLLSIDLTNTLYVQTKELENLYMDNWAKSKSNLTFPKFALTWAWIACQSLSMNLACQWSSSLCSFYTKSSCSHWFIQKINAKSHSNIKICIFSHPKQWLYVVGLPHLGGRSIMRT